MPAPYDTLLEHVRAVLAEAGDHSRQAGERAKVDTYWHVGDAIYVHLQGRAERAAYGQQIIHNLSKDIALPQSTLHDIVRFRRTFTILSTSRELAWSHYRVLIRLPRVDQRRFYERLAHEQAWSVRDLEAHIGAGEWQHAVGAPLAVDPGEDPFAGHPLRARRGELYTYRVLTDPGAAAPTHLDLGFQIQRATDLSHLPGLRAGQVVTSERTAAGRYHLRANPGRRPKLWTYRARIDRVVDGDTLVATVDLGFDLRTPQRLRLRGIDTPERGFTAGQRARDYVVEALTDAGEVVVSTTRTDRYGRYVADVFYLPGETDPWVVLSEGVYLNRRLLEERLARRYLR